MVCMLKSKEWNLFPTDFVRDSLLNAAISTFLISFLFYYIVLLKIRNWKLISALIQFNNHSQPLFIIHVYIRDNACAVAVLIFCLL